MKEVLQHFQAQISQSSILEKEELSPKDYFLVSAHREENIDSEINFANLLESLAEIERTYKKRIIVSTHPRTRKKLEALGFEHLPNVTFSKPYGFFDYITLQTNAFCVISDSGTITEESSLLGFPAITIRQAHERPEGMDSGVLIMSGLEKKGIIKSIDVITSRAKPTNLIPDYDVEMVSDKVLNVILSYTDYVNRTVWRKGY